MRVPEVPHLLLAAHVRGRPVEVLEQLLVLGAELGGGRVDLLAGVDRGFNHGVDHLHHAAGAVRVAVSAVRVVGRVVGFAVASLIAVVAALAAAVTPSLAPGLGAALALAFVAALLRLFRVVVAENLDVVVAPRAASASASGVRLGGGGEGRDALGTRTGQRARARGRGGSQLGINLTLQPVAQASLLALGDAGGDASRARVGVRGVGVVGLGAERGEDLGVGGLDDVLRGGVVGFGRGVAESREPVEIRVSRFLEARLLELVFRAGWGRRALERGRDDARYRVDSLARDTLACGRDRHRSGSDSPPSGRQRRRREHANRGPDDQTQHPDGEHHGRGGGRAEQLADDAAALAVRGVR
mmetsp:Transcript_8648/g.38163  ORF Transcript_8648/g.38163 Transcript_8648/m.38163 type:complete len:357 (-) Transcript_8648:283-1353(-)